MNGVRQFISHVKSGGTRLPGVVRISSMGREREFEAYELGADVFIFERSISSHLNERPSVLMVCTGRLNRRSRGRVMTISTGNHSVAALPLLDGRFWKISRLIPSRRGEVMMNGILCANVTDGVLEISQRDVSTADLVAFDRWLVEDLGLGMDGVVMLDRNEATLEHYRKLGQEWRVKPLAWTENEMQVALASSRKRISSKIEYFHSSRGVHFLTYPAFIKFISLAETSPGDFVAGLRELTGVFEGSSRSFVRTPKYRGHHEVDFFGIRRGVAIEKLVPELESLMEAIALGRLGQLGVIQKARALAQIYESLLTRPEFADASSKVFTETLYMHLTGEIYAVAGDGSTPAFDDRRTALPGATFVKGRPVMHPGSDERSEVLLSNLRGMLSKDEFIEYANVYEIREDENVPTGKGLTREVVYKTNMRPIESSLVEKGLASKRRGYAEYMLARIGALRSLGVTLSSYYRLLRRRPSTRSAPLDYYIRTRCEGEPLDSIPANWFRSSEDSSVEEAEVVKGVATLMGDAAAQNMAMKKFDQSKESPLFGVGKEIYEFEYDILKEQIVPKKVATCSIRGSFGWPDLSYTDENVNAMASFYFTHYTHALKAFCKAHTVPMAELAERFMSGFEFRTHAMAWQLSVMRDKFESFNPPVPSVYHFAERWKFVMWSLERQERRLPLLRKMFLEKVSAVECAEKIGSCKQAPSPTGE